MANSTHAKLLRQKIEHAHARSARASLRESLLGEIRISLGKVFLEHLGIEVKITITDSRIGGNTAIIDRLNTSLFGLLALPGGMGLAGFDRAFIDTSVLRLSGAADTDPANTTERAFTRTDAALAGQVVNLFLTQAFCPAPKGESAENFGMKAFEREKAPLPYILDDPQYALLTIQIESDKKTIGTLELMLPLDCISAMSETDTPDTAPIEPDIWQVHMADVAEHAPLMLDTVVERMHLPLGRVLSLKPGEMLTLPDASLQHITLEAQSTNGAVKLCDGQLGALKAFKAFRVTHPVPEKIA